VEEREDVDRHELFSTRAAEPRPCSAPTAPSTPVVAVRGLQPCAGASVGHHHHLAATVSQQHRQLLFFLKAVGAPPELSAWLGFLPYSCCRHLASAVRRRPCLGPHRRDGLRSALVQRGAALRAARRGFQHPERGSVIAPARSGATTRADASFCRREARQLEHAQAGAPPRQRPARRSKLRPPRGRERRGSARSRD
jgi:hypothetical protein